MLSVGGRRLPNDPVPVDVIFPKNEPVKEPVNGAVRLLNCVELLMTPSVSNSFFTPSRKCTELVFNVIVPALVIVPPDKPSPAVMEVTVPDPPGAQLADTANDADVIVPKNEPVNDPVTPVVAFTNALTRILDSDGGVDTNVNMLVLRV